MQLKYFTLLLVNCLSGLLLGCSGTSGSSSNALATGVTWPPKSAAEFLAAIDGKVYKLEGYSDTVKISNGTITYYGPASDWHSKYVYTTPTSRYLSQAACNYTGAGLTINPSNYSISYTFTANSNYEPTIDHCPIYVGGASLAALADPSCIGFDGAKYCVQ
jgi:hypothetical protein